jgi:hypothetical protein
VTKNSKKSLVAAVVLFLVCWTVYAYHATSQENAKVLQKALDKKKAQSANTHGKDSTPAEIPKPVGPEDAPAKIEVFVNGGNSCHSDTVTTIRNIADEEPYKGKVRISFVDTTDPANKKKAANAKIGCDAGLLVNGKSAMRIPGHGEAGLVIFTGPIGQKNYTMADLKAGLDIVIKEAGEKKGK